jgi:beta-N-acetylhexosaminidase
MDSMDPTSDAAIARLFTVGFAGTTPSPELEELLKRGVGGVILFRRNIEAPEQVLELTRSIKRLAARPLFVGIDQEGGRVRRLRAGFTDIPPMRALGLTGDSALALEVGRLLGRELSAVGIDLNFAPVVDVDTNPDNPVIGDRAFGSDAALVAELGRALVRGLESEGVAACAKHFPGHGDTHQDSHATLPRLAHALERLERVELVPFRAVAEAGVASMMTAHVVLEALDAQYPATLSELVLARLLRDSIGFDGVVFSDDMEMQAIAGRFDWATAAVRALGAGVDSLLVCHSAEVVHTMIDAVSQGLSDGTVRPARVAQALGRVEALTRGFAAPPRVSSDLSVLDCREHRRIADRLRMALLGEPLGIDPTEAVETLPAAPPRRGEA